MAKNIKSHHPGLQKPHSKDKTPTKSRGKNGFYRTKTGKEIMISDATSTLKTWEENEAPHYDEVMEQV